MGPNALALPHGEDHDPTPEQLRLGQYSGFVEGVLDAQLTGTDMEKALAIFVTGFLEQSQGSIPDEVLGRISDKRLELQRRINQRGQESTLQ